MKKFLKLLIPLLTVIMSGCLSTSATVELPPRPERQEMPEIRNLADCAKALNYYEHLVQEWELWGNTVIDIVENP